MSEKHTGGPWISKDIYIIPEYHSALPIGGSTDRERHVQGYAHVIAMVSDDEKRFKREAWQANARLLAAAPDMQKTLQLVLSGLENGSIKSKPILDMGDENAESLPIVSLHSVIRAVLEKAGAA